MAVDAASEMVGAGVKAERMAVGRNQVGTTAAERVAQAMMVVERVAKAMMVVVD